MDERIKHSKDRPVNPMEFVFHDIRDSLLRIEDLLSAQVVKPQQAPNGTIKLQEPVVAANQSEVVPLAEPKDAQKPAKKRTRRRRTKTS